MHKLIVKLTDAVLLLSSAIIVAAAYMAFGIPGALCAGLACALIVSMWSVQRAILAELERINRAPVVPLRTRKEPQL